MNRPLPANLNRKARLCGMAAMLAAVLTSGSIRAQVATADVKAADSAQVTQAGCTSCAAEKLFPYQSPTMPLGCTGCMGNLGCGGCGGDCGGPGCVPGRLPCCAPCEKEGAFGRVFFGVHAVLCCPDPRFEHRFLPDAQSGFFFGSA